MKNIEAKNKNQKLEDFLKNRGLDIFVILLISFLIGLGLLLIREKQEEAVILEERPAAASLEAAPSEEIKKPVKKVKDKNVSNLIDFGIKIFK